jgi:hypothetical protein
MKRASLRPEFRMGQIEGKIREYAYYSDTGKILRQYRLDSNRVVYGRSGQPAIILYNYNSSDQLTKTTFLDKDSILCPNKAYIIYKYDKFGRLISEASYDSSSKIANYSYPISFNYNSKGMIVSKVREGKTERSSFADPGMVKYQYDNHGRIALEQYLNSKGETSSVYEMGIQSIKYEYNAKGQLISETWFYSGTIDPEAEAKYEWVHIYTYGENDQLIRCDVTWEYFDEKNSYSTFYKYNPEKKLYGAGTDSSAIRVAHPFDEIENVVYQEIYSNDYYPHMKRVKFR